MTIILGIYYLDCRHAHRGASSGDRPEAEHGAALRAGFVTPLPGGSGAPPAGHYDPAAQDARRTRRKCQSAVCEAVRPELESLSLSNAAVKRREARRSALLADGPLRKGDRPNRKAANGCGVPHQRLAALHSPHARNEGTWDDKTWTTRRTRRLSNNTGDVACLFDSRRAQ